MIKPWKIISKSVYQHSSHRALEDVVYELPDGRRESFSLYKQGRAGAVLAFDQNGDVILARQFRPGPDRVLDELPGGGFHHDESNIEGIKREFLEETGYEAKEWIELGQVYECAYATVERYGFVALDCAPVAPESKVKSDESEFIEVITKPIAEFLDQLGNGLATDLEIGWAGLYRLGYLKLIEK